MQVASTEGAVIATGMVVFDAEVVIDEQAMGDHEVMRLVAAESDRVE